MPAGKKYKPSQKSGEIVLEALFTTLRGFNPLSGNLSPQQRNSRQQQQTQLSAAVQCLVI